MKNSRPLILIVDSDAQSCQMVAKMLEPLDCDVVIAIDGKETIQALSDNSFDLIISEVRLPDFTGYELMRKICMLEIRTEVVFLTAFGDWESYIDLMNMGAFDYINKSSSEVEILGIVSRALAGNPELAELHSSG